jgi:hypothetical protein
MKKLLILLAFVAITISGFSQSKWDGFFKPVTPQQFQNYLKGVSAVNANVWLFRPAVSIAATMVTYDNTTKQWNATAFNSVGMGIGYQHYIDLNGIPYNNFGFNALVFVNATPDASLSFAGTVSALKFIDVGAGINTGTRNFFALLGIRYNF